MNDEESTSKPDRPEADSPEPEVPATGLPDETGASETTPGQRGEADPEAPSVEPVAPPPVSQEAGTPQYDWSKPPGAAAWQPAPDRPPDAMDHLIPSKNPPALIGYYLGCFSVIPCLMPFLGPAAVVYGIKGLKAVKTNPNLPGAGHAVTAVVLGALTTLTFAVGLVAVIVAWATGNMK